MKASSRTRTIPKGARYGDLCSRLGWRHLRSRTRNGELLLEKGAYLASSEGITCDSKWDGLRGFFNEGMFVLRVTGTGTLFFHAYGDIYPIDVNGEYVVDNGFAVAWEPTLTYRLTRGRKIRSFLFSDQLLLRFSGHGRIWLQSRSPRSLAAWAYPFRPVESRQLSVTSGGEA